MREWFDERAREIEEATPKERDRYADFLRLAAICVVVVGHWLAPHISMGPVSVRVRLVFGMVEPLQWLTWLFQVMPVFFFVGGMINALSWERASADKSYTYVDWLRRRARRLLWPLVPLLVAWIFAALVLESMGMRTTYVSRASHAVLYPIWFLAAYLCVVAVAPLAHWMHRRLGWIALAAMVAAAGVVDALVWAGWNEAAWLNFLFVWGAIHQAGFFWYERGLSKRVMVGVSVAATALVGLWLLVRLSPYSATMVAAGFERRPNDLPPSIALLGLATAQFGLLVALRRPVERWLQRAGVWAVVSLGGQRIMTIYLWHMTAMIVVALALIPTEIWPMPTEPDTTWWLLRIPWVLLLSCVLALLVVVFGRFEQPETADPASRSGVLETSRAVVSVGLVSFGIARLMLDGLYAGGGISGLSWTALAVLGLGLVGLGVFRRD